MSNELLSLAGRSSGTAPALRMLLARTAHTLLPELALVTPRAARAARASGPVRTASPADANTNSDAHANDSSRSTGKGAAATSEMCHSYPCPCPSRFVEHV